MVGIGDLKLVSFVMTVVQYQLYKFSSRKFRYI